jgi:uncharacterized protein (TIGR01777 family)
METILITGGTGLIGSHLCPRLEEEGYAIALLSRRKKSVNGYQIFEWNPEKEEIEEGAIESADYIIHLAGANIGEKKWTQKRKKEIVESRIKGIDFLYRKIKKKNKSIKAFVSSSAVGYYGSVTGGKIYNENDSPGNDFLAQVCVKWEKAADQFQHFGIRTVKLRSGVVLSREGGALDQMKTPVQMGIGSPLGSGKQYVPWIHIDDLCSIYIKAIEESKITGAYNAVAPDYRTNAEFMHLIADISNKPFWLPAVPAVMLKFYWERKLRSFWRAVEFPVKKFSRKVLVLNFPHLKMPYKIY